MNAKINHSNDLGIISVLLEHLNRQILPRATSLKEKVDRGEQLNDFDIAYLETELSDVRRVQLLVENHPEYKPLAAQVISLYKDIVDKAVENGGSTTL